MALIDVHGKLDFGKYEGEYVQYIIDTDPWYLLWLDQNDCDRLDSLIYTLAEESAEKKNGNHP